MRRLPVLPCAGPSRRNQLGERVTSSSRIDVLSGTCHQRTKDVGKPANSGTNRSGGNLAAQKIGAITGASLNQADPGIIDVSPRLVRFNFFF